MPATAGISQHFVCAVQPIHNRKVITMTTTNAKAIRESLIEAAKAGSKVMKEQEKLQAKREGAYTHAVRAGIAANGDAKAFLAVCEQVMDEIRTNANGLARACGAPAAKPTKDGERRWKVPMAVSAAKTYISQAIEFGVALTGDDNEPRSYNAVRKDVDTARAEHAREHETAEETQRREIGEFCDLIGERARKLDGAALDTLHGSVKALYDALNAGVKAEAESKAAGKQLEAAAKSATTTRRSRKSTAAKGRKAA